MRMKLSEFLYTKAKLYFANTSQSTTKSSSIKFKKKVEISLELVKVRLVLGFDLRSTET